MKQVRIFSLSFAPLAFSLRKRFPWKIPCSSAHSRVPFCENQASTRSAAQALESRFLRPLVKRSRTLGGLLHWPTIIREEKATEWPSWIVPDRRKGWKDFQLVSLSARDLEFLLFFSEKIKLEMYGIIFIHSECFLIVVILRVIRFNLSRPSGLKKKWVHFEAIQNFSTSISRTHGTLDFVRKRFWSSPFVHIFENILNERRNQFPMGISSLSLSRFISQTPTKNICIFSWNTFSQ